jgi:peptide/nickel transport system substrate-binding protein
MDDPRRLFGLATVCVAVAALLLTACRPATGERSSSSDRIALRVGVPQLPADTANGLRQFAQNRAVESLASLADDGRPRPGLAKDWQVSADGLALTVNLRSGVTFHDGTPVTSPIVADSIRQALPYFMGPAFGDVENVTATSETQVVVRLRSRSPFLVDVLEVPVPKPGAALMGTGPFIVVDPTTELKANPKYYLGPPTVDQILVQTFPSVRTAWAELLRGQLDMLYEVGIDALDSLEASTNVAVFTYARHYQYVVILNSNVSTFQSKEARRALNLAVDREALVRDVLKGHGTVSSGPVWPHNWAFRSDRPTLMYDPAAAVRTFATEGRAHGHSGRLGFKLLVRKDDINERIALVLKQQLDAVGVDMSIEEAGMDRIVESVSSHHFDAALIETLSGPTLLRSYKMWHSGSMNANSATLDGALDRLRHAESDEESLKAVAALQQTVAEDPPAIFLAWMERARAVSKRFTVPPGEPGRDILSNLRLWKPSADARQATRN